MLLDFGNLVDYVAFAGKAEESSLLPIVRVDVEELGALTGFAGLERTEKGKVVAGFEVGEHSRFPFEERRVDGEGVRLLEAKLGEGPG
jgi:hypothetical protein